MNGSKSERLMKRHRLLEEWLESLLQFTDTELMLVVVFMLMLVINFMLVLVLRFMLILVSFLECGRSGGVTSMRGDEN